MSIKYIVTCRTKTKVKREKANCHGNFFSDSIHIANPKNGVEWRKERICKKKKKKLTFW